jgi:polyhydroxyalkanoate synthesis repressor PhaR
VVRLIKRYGSRKLYDTEASRYVSLEDLAARIREGHEIRVIEKRTSQDVTSQTLAQVIVEEGKRPGAFPPELLHSLIRDARNRTSTAPEPTRGDNGAKIPGAREAR